MALKNQVSNVYSVGLGNVGSYQVSGQPYLSGAVQAATIGSNTNGHYVFPTVTKKVIITNNEPLNAPGPVGDAIVSFAPFSAPGDYGYTNEASSSGNWIFLSASKSIELDVKCKEIFVTPAYANTCSVTMFAELTNIPTPRMYSLDGVEGVTKYVAPTITLPTRNQTTNVYGSGLRNMGSYQVSGRPFITGSNIVSDENSIIINNEKFVDFPKVTKSLTVWNHSTNLASKLRVHFATTSSMTNYPANGCYVELSSGETTTLNVKCKKVYLSAVGGDVLWKLYASLTNIPSERMYVLTGSGISE
jgi:hypothetical protein